MYSPRMRGLSEVIHVAIHVGGAFPPYAGVIGANRKSGCLKNGIPPVAGVIGVCWRSLKIVSSIPPMRGLSGSGLTMIDMNGVFPPVCGGYR